jgi:hypothetical protein
MAGFTFANDAFWQPLLARSGAKALDRRTVAFGLEEPFTAGTWSSESYRSSAAERFCFSSELADT